MWNRNDVMGMLAACLTFFPGAALADDRVQVHGFFSQAAVHTDANDVGGNSRNGVGLDMREMGANISFRPNGDWLFSAQALARWAGNTDEGDPRVDYAFVDHTLSSGEGSRVGLQIGKVKNPYGLYNMTRDVAHTRPSITMPQSIYLDRVRDFYLASPGISLYGNHAHEAWETNWRLNVMQPEADSVDQEYLAMLRDAPGSFRGRNSWLGQWMAERDGGRLRIGLTIGVVKNQYRPGAVDPLTAGESTFKPTLLSLEWNEEMWSLAAEYGQVKSISKNYGPFGAAIEQPNTVEAWYLQGTYRINPQLQIYLRRDELYLDKDDKNGAQFAGPGRPAHLKYAKDWVLGVKREWNAWALSGEIHSIDGTAWLSPLDTPILGQKGTWHMFLLQAAYRF